MTAYNYTRGVDTSCDNLGYTTLELFSAAEFSFIPIIPFKASILRIGHWLSLDLW